LNHPADRISLAQCGLFRRALYSIVAMPGFCAGRNIATQSPDGLFVMTHG
jgi:hypothetical protein